MGRTQSFNLSQYIKSIGQNHWLNQTNQKDQVKQVEIVVPVFNGFAALTRCVNGLLAHTSKEYPITFLNDASSDQQVASYLDVLSLQHPQITIIHRDHNLGYLHNVNHYLKQCKHDVLLLNSDTLVTAGWLESILQVAADDRVGVVCPLSDCATILSLSTTDPEQLKQLSQFSQQWYPIPTAVGFCMLVKRQVWNQMGGFDPFYHPGYGEECELSLLARNAGLQIACAPGALVFHQGSQSFKSQATLLQEQHQKLLDLRWPHYSGEVAAFQASNPVIFIEQALKATVAIKPRILHVVHNIDNKGGVELFTRELINQFDDRFEHTVLIPQRAKKHQDSPIKLNHCEVIEVSTMLSKPNHIIFNLAADPYHQPLDIYFKNLLNSGRFDLVHFHSLVGFGTAVWPLLCHHLNIPYQLFFHDHGGLCPIFSLSTTKNEQEIYCGKTSHQFNDSQCQNCLQQKTLQSTLTTDSLMKIRTMCWQQNIDHASFIYFSSEYLQQIYGKKFTGIKDKSEVFSPCFYPDKSTPCKVINPSEINIAFLGQFGVIKGAQMFIDLTRSISQPFIKWHIIGGVSANYQDQLDNSEIIHLGSYETEQLSQRLANIDLIVFTSQIPETYGITLSEAWFHGIPVIAPNLGAYSSRVVDGVNGYLYQANELNSLVNVVNQWIDNQQHGQSIKCIEYHGEAQDHTIQLQQNYQNSLVNQTPIDNSTTKDVLLNKPKINAYQYMNQWLDAPSTLEAEADWFPVPESVTVVVLGDDAWVNATITNLNETLPKPKILQASQGTEILNTSDPVLLITAGSFLNVNFGNWLAAFKNSQAVISLSDYALSNGIQQSYAPQFQNRFSWQNFLQFQHHVGCLLVNLKQVDQLTLKAVFSGLKPLTALVKKTYHLDSKQVHHFPHYSHDVYDVQWVQQWKSAIEENQIKNSSPSENLSNENAKIQQNVLILLECNVPNHPFIQSLKQQSLVTKGLATIMVFNSESKTESLRKVDYQDYDYVVMVNDNVVLLHKAVLELSLYQLHQSSLDVLSPVVQYPVFDQYLIAKKWGAANYFVGMGLVKDLRFVNSDGAIEGDLVDDDFILFKQSAWQAVYQQVAEHRDHYLPLKLAKWLHNSQFKTGLYPCKLLGKKGLPSAALSEQIPELKAQRTQLVDQQYHLPDQTTYSTAFSCRHACGLDLKIPTFKTPKHLPRVVAYAHDNWASGFYRVKAPLSALAAANQISTLFLPNDNNYEPPTPYEIHRLKPDALLLHHFYSDQQLAALCQYKKQLKLKIILGADDLLSEIPEYNTYHSKTPTDIDTRIKTACAVADTLVVSTEYLAQEMQVFHNNIKVIPNQLSKTIWQNLNATKTNGSKLRVGWAGAGQHQQDLELLVPIIEATKGICDWVFFGDQPQSISNHSIEYHTPVDLLHYPEKLHQLNLDLAVAPLVENQFNRAKSNLKLLEYGVLSLPVLASDIICYQDSPATLLANQPKLWIEQLNQYHQDRNLIIEDGQKMKHWVDQQFWLEDHLAQWMDVLGLG